VLLLLFGAGAGEDEKEQAACIRLTHVNVVSLQNNNVQERQQVVGSMQQAVAGCGGQQAACNMHVFRLWVHIFAHKAN
jgi:hypothetical protein